MVGLDGKYFESVNSKIQDGHKYTVYRPKDHPMILFSKIDGTPLASLHLRCQDNEYQSDHIGNRGRALITKRPYRSEFKCDFQGIINRDNQEFELVITNLSNLGMININILKCDRKVDEVNPGGLNQVNELHKLQSYAVKCDQMNNGILVLNTIKNNGASVTVGQDEDMSQGSKPTGTYYYLSVVGQINEPELVAKFADTEWTCPDVFCIKEKYQESRGRFRLATARGYDDLESLQGGSYRGVQQDCLESVRSRGINMEESMNEDVLLCTASVSTGDGSRFVSKGVSSDIIKDSYAGSVSTGRKIKVYSNETGIEYNYETPSAPCVIGLSVSDKIDFRMNPSPEEYQEMAAELLKNVTESSLKEYLDNLTRVYIETNCVICLDDAPDSVFYQCGHQCCHYGCVNNIRKCPMCRLHITATINLAKQD